MVALGGGPRGTGGNKAPNSTIHLPFVLCFWTGTKRNPPWVKFKSAFMIKKNPKFPLPLQWQNASEKRRFSKPCEDGVRQRGGGGAQWDARREGTWPYFACIHEALHQPTRWAVPIPKEPVRHTDRDATFSGFPLPKAIAHITLEDRPE